MIKVVMRLKGISKYYGSQRILTRIDMEIARGELVGIVGANGSGKSTLLKVITGLVYPNEGTLTNPTGMRVKIRGLLDKPGFFPGFCLEKNLVLFTQQVSRQVYDETIERLGLKAYLHRKFSNCSTGLQKRCELAAALMHEPDLLIMDEPISGLDPAGIYAFRSIMRDMQARQGAVLLTDHALGELEKICSRICFLKQGIMQAIVPMDELLKKFDTLEEAYRFYNLKIS